MYIRATDLHEEELTVSNCVMINCLHKRRLAIAITIAAVVHYTCTKQYQVLEQVNIP